MAITYTATVNQECINAIGGKDSGTATSGTTTALNDTGKAWTTNAYAGRKVWIYSGTGIGQIRRIESNIGTQLVPTVAFTTAPDATSLYLVLWNWDDVYLASVAGGWGKATKQGKQYRFTADVRIGDGTAYSGLGDEEKDIEIVLPSGFANAYPVNLSSPNAIYCLGNKDVNGNEYGGCKLYVDSTACPQSLNFIGGAGSPQGATFFYDNILRWIAAPTFFLFGRPTADVEWIGNTISGHRGLRFSGTGSILRRNRVHDGLVQGFSFGGTVAEASGFSLFREDRAFKIFSTYGCVLSEAEFRNNNYDFYVDTASTSNGILVDCTHDGAGLVSDTKLLRGQVSGSWTGYFDEQKTLQFRTIDTANNPIQDVRIAIYDTNGTEVFNGLTGADGKHALQTLTVVRRTAGGSATTFTKSVKNPFIVKQRKYGITFVEESLQLEFKTRQDRKEYANPYIVASEATASTYSSKVTMDFVNRTITVTGSANPQELYDYHQYAASQSGAMAYNPLVTFDGRVLTFQTTKLIINPGATFLVNPELYQVKFLSGTPVPCITNNGTLTLGVKTGSSYTSGVAIRCEKSVSTIYGSAGLLCSTQNGSVFNAYGATIETGATASLCGDASAEKTGTVNIEKLTVKNINATPSNIMFRFDNAVGQSVNVSGLTLTSNSTADVRVAFATDYTTFSCEFLSGEIKLSETQAYDLIMDGIAMADNIAVQDAVITKSASPDVVIYADNVDIGSSIRMARGANNYGSMATRETLTISPVGITDWSAYLPTYDDGNQLEPNGRTGFNWTSEPVYVFDETNPSQKILTCTGVNNGTIIKKSYRGISHDDTDDFRYIITSYGSQPLLVDVVLKGEDGVVSEPTLLMDLGVTQATKATVGAYTGFSGETATEATITTAHTTSEVYDRRKYQESENPAWVWDEGETKASSASGSQYDFTTDYILTLNAVLSGKKITGANLVLGTGWGIACPVENIALSFPTAGTYDLRGADISGTITLVNTSGGAVTVKLPIGTAYTRSGSPLPVVELSANVSITWNTLLDGTRIVVRNKDNGALLYNGVKSGDFVFSFDIGVGKDVENGDEVKVLTAYCVGTTAKNELDKSFIASSSSVTYTEAQTDFTVYNNYAIDGSSVTEFVPDYPNFELDLNDPNGTLGERGMARMVYLGTTEFGILAFHGAMTVEDEQNCKFNSFVVDFHIENVGVPTIIRGMRLYRDDDATILSATSNALELNWGKVYAGANTAPTEEEIWTYATRTLTEDVGGGATPEEIWEYNNRSLTQSIGGGGGYTEVTKELSKKQEEKLAERITDKVVETLSEREISLSDVKVNEQISRIGDKGTETLQNIQEKIANPIVNVKTEKVEVDLAKVTSQIVASEEKVSNKVETLADDIKTSQKANKELLNGISETIGDAKDYARKTLATIEGVE